MLLIGVCLLSAALFATGNSLQHVGANNLGGTNLPPLQIALRLARNKTWLLGSAIALTAFGTHVLALGLGEVGVVQPLLLVGVIFGICFRPLLDGARAHVIEISGAVIAVAGLILYIRAGAIYDSEPVAPRGDASSFSVVVVALVCLLLLCGPRLGLSAPIVFALCAGTLMGTGAGLFKELLSRDDPMAHVLGWVLPVAILLEVAGTFLNQRAYHAGPLSRSMPVVNVASVLIGGLFGILVFGELPRHDPVSLAFQAAGIGLACLGLVMLTRHEATPALDSERRSNLVS